MIYCIYSYILVKNDIDCYLKNKCWNERRILIGDYFIHKSSYVDKTIKIGQGTKI